MTNLPLASFQFARHCLVQLILKMFSTIPTLLVLFLGLCTFTAAVIGILCCIFLLALPFIVLIDIVLKFIR
jgi:hypothetical protein